MTWEHLPGEAGPMTLDTSAVLAVLQDEPERSTFVSLMEQAPRRLLSVVSVLEAAMVLEGRRGEDAGSDLDQFLRTASVQSVAFDQEQLALARSAFRRFGKGHHPAGLNFGDCAAYALSQCAVALQGHRLHGNRCSPRRKLKSLTPAVALART